MTWISGMGSGSKGNGAYIAAEGQHQDTYVVGKQRGKKWEKKPPNYWLVQNNGLGENRGHLSHEHMFICTFSCSVPPAPVPPSLVVCSSLDLLVHSPIHQAPVLLFSEG